jgi:pantothenate kinase-related protein Tda10
MLGICRMMLLGCVLWDFLQAELAASNSNNGLLKLRGNAGSHDLQLGTDTLKALRSLTSSGMKAKVPRYDKSANAGFGDRADPSKWSEVEGPLKVVLFEGWMLGFEPEDEAAVTAVDPQVSLCLLPLSERILNKVSGCSKLQTAMEDHIQ